MKKAIADPDKTSCTKNASVLRESAVPERSNEAGLSIENRVTTAFSEANTASSSECEALPENSFGKKLPCGALFDVTNQKILFSKNINKKVYPASLTKLATACTALQYVPADTVFTVGSEQELVNNNSSLCLIQSGHKLTLYDLICGMLIASGNDAAYTIAVNTARHVYSNKVLSDEQAVGLFCQLMNGFAEDIKMNNSHFTNPDGWDDREQYTTVNDLLKIAVYAHENDTVNSIVSCAEKYVLFASGQNITWKNTNKLLDKESEYYFPYASGMKTGSTEKAGKNLIASASKDEKTIIAIAIGCKTESQRYSSVIRMFNKAFKA